MRYQRIHAGLATMVALAAFCAGPGAQVAHAQEAPVPTLTSVNANAGGSDDISGGGCAAKVAVQIQFDGAALVTTRSANNGRYSAHLIIPVSAVPGSHRITIVCAGPSGQVSNSTTVSVGLPVTGADDAPLVAVALLSILIGAPLVLSRRRRLA